MPETILVFDSGLGGSTVLREIVKLRPGARYVYVADDVYFPYGKHTEADIVARVVPLIGEIIATHKPDIVVIACNTASTLVMDHLRKTYDVPFVGTVPAIKPACASSTTKRVSVLGTKGTVQREYTKKLIADFAQGCEVTLVGAENLAALAESDLKGELVGDAAIAAEIAPCFVDAVNGKGARTDTVVLACTHYPLLMDRLIVQSPWPVQWIDPAPAIARRVSDLLGTPASAESGTAQIIFTSGQSLPANLKSALAPFFGASFIT